MESFKKMFNGGSEFSFKRGATFIALMLFSLCTIVELFTVLEVSKETSSSLIYLIGFGIGTVASERFGNKNEDK